METAEETVEIEQGMEEGMEPSENEEVCQIQLWLEDDYAYFHPQV